MTINLFKTETMGHAYTPYLVGITGGSASGKTLFLKRLISKFDPDEICLVCLDNYYRSRDQQPLDNQGIPNFDTPFSIDSNALARDIALLKSGVAVERQEYTYNNPKVAGNILSLKPAPIIVVEGIFVLYFREVAEQLDLKIFIDAKEHIKLMRRIKRDQEERGYPIEDILYRYEKHVSPTYERYIEPYKHEADLLIPNNDGFNKALEMVAIYLKKAKNDRNQKNQ